MTTINYDKFVVYTDGACRNNGKHNALSSIGIYFSNHNLYKIDNVSEVLKGSSHTNNIAELTAINKSLSLIKEHDIKLPIHLYTDSKSSMNILTKDSPTPTTVWTLPGGVIAPSMGQTFTGTNNLGQLVSAGMYIYNIQVGDFKSTKKMLLLK